VINPFRRKCLLARISIYHRLHGDGENDDSVQLNVGCEPQPEG
jgi:hypothetical protein